MMRKKSEILSIIEEIKKSNELLIEDKFNAIENGNWKKAERINNEMCENNSIIHALKWVMLQYNEVNFN